MRVLIAHNEYRSSMPSGENLVVEREADLLRRAGVEVETFIRSSDSFFAPSASARLAAGVSAVTGHGIRAEFTAALDRFRPDVVHLHNPYPLLSPRLIDLALAKGVPSVATIHNYRVACLSGLLFRDGAGCSDCLDRNSKLPGVAHGCYRSSRAQSLVMAAALTRNEDSYRRARMLLPVSGFVAAFLHRVGFDPSRVQVKYNFCPDPGHQTTPGDGFLYVGRLSEEKGLHLLLEAWRHSGLGLRTSLTVVGSGPLEGLVKLIAEGDPSVRFLGRREADEVVEIRRTTRVAIVPSIWHDPHPLTVVESLASGRPVIGTRMGGIADLLDDSVGWLAEPTVESLSEAIRSAATNSNLQNRCVAARSRYLKYHSRDAVSAGLLSAYRAVLT